MTNAVAPVGNVAGTMETTFRLLVPERHTGSIIGKGGEVGTPLGPLIELVFRLC